MDNVSKPENSPKPRSYSLLLIICGILLLGLGLLGGYIIGNKQQPASLPNPSPAPQQIPTTIASPSPFSSPTQPLPTSTVSVTTAPSDWLIYKNSTYGFEIMYPKTYKALDDKNNLYGWPNGIVLFYKGGQSYDIAIQAWNTKEDYEKAYPGGSYEVTVKQVNNKYLTIVNLTKDPQNAEIITTFKFIN